MKLTVDQTKKEVSRLLGVTESQFDLDAKLGDNWQLALNVANDIVCRELRIPVRTTSLSTTDGSVPYSAIGGTSTVREDGILQVKYLDGTYVVVLPVLSRSEADSLYPQWESAMFTGINPVFALWEPGDTSAGLKLYPAVAASLIIRWLKAPDTLAASGTSFVLDGELASWHHLVPLLTAARILDRDYFGGEAGDGTTLGGNARKQQKIYQEYQTELERAKREVFATGAYVSNPMWRYVRR